MKLGDVLFDTSVYVSYDLPDPLAMPGWLSTVVLQELVVGSNGRADLKKHRAMLVDYRRRGRLIVPDENVWFQAGQILNHILNDESRKHPDRHRPKFSNDKKQSIIRDVLIAVSAKQQNLTVISDNEDFPLIAEYYKFRWKTGHEFFG